MGFFTRTSQREADIRPGDKGTVVLLADRSTSMPSHALIETNQLLPEFKAAIPNLRIFIFHANMIEIRDLRGICDFCGGLYREAPDRGGSKDGGVYRNTTYLGAALQKIASLNPSKTIILSDGGAADKELALRVVDGMTGSIDCYWCPSGWCDRSFMGELARRGRGRFVDAMPDAITRDLRKTIEVLRGPLLRRVHKAPEFTREGLANKGNVSVGGSKITVTRR